MTVFFTSDTHFLHKKVAEIRGFHSVEAHDGFIVQQWNELVRADDIVWLLGDVGIPGKGKTDSDVLDLVDQLNGRKHLVTGNHDSVWPANRNAKNNQYKWLGYFESVQAFARQSVCGTDFLLSHFPYEGDSARHDEDRATQFRLRDEGMPLLHGDRLAYLVLEVSEAGRAPRQKPSLFALATVFAFGDVEAKQSARAVFNRVVRTASHLFTFVKYAGQFRGWGPSLTKAVAGWYLAKNPQALSYQLVKYRQRDGFTHRDVLRLAHPKTTDAEKKALFAWAVGKGMSVEDTWTPVYEAAQALGRREGQDKDTALYGNLIRQHPGLPWEALPDEALNVPETWEALLDATMPITALIRQLPRLTKLGLTDGQWLSKITAQLTDADSLRKGRVHPVKLLYALKTYGSGHSFQGSSTWTPNQRVVDALDAGFYLAFGTVEPAGKRTLLALDVSGSMTWNTSDPVTAREGSVAMAMVTVATEPSSEVVAFDAGPGSTRYASRGYYDTGINSCAVSPRRRLDDNLATVNSMVAGGTDCALPMIWAKANKRDFDTFVIYTDNETHSGRIHPVEALRDYRQSSGNGARLVVVGMTSTGFSIADPKDPLALDVAGFDSDTPGVISGFSRGDFG